MFHFQLSWLVWNSLSYTRLHQIGGERQWFWSPRVICWTMQSSQQPFPTTGMKWVFRDVSNAVLTLYSLISQCLQQQKTKSDPFSFVPKPIAPTGRPEEADTSDRGENQKYSSKDILLNYAIIIVSALESQNQAITSCDCFEKEIFPKIKYL